MKSTASAFHEDLGREPAGRASTNRAFGLVFAGVFLVVAAAPVAFGGRLRLWSVAVAAAMLLLAILAPNVLAPLNRAWMWVGMRLHQIMSPVVLGLMFGAFIVVGWLMGRRRYEALGLQFDPTRRSYWVDREPPGPPPESMRHQF